MSKKRQPKLNNERVTMTKKNNRKKILDAEHKKKLQEGRKKAAKVKKISKTMRRNRKPGETCTMKFAIKSFCLECMGDQVGEVRKCTAPTCWLWPYRLGGLDEAVHKEIKSGEFKAG